ncbi:MAG: transketolase [Ignavibacteria bacterium]|nr:transketolase [Ignavibacteria bacterium]
MGLSEKEINELNSKALKVREHIIRMSTEGGCFTGASLSCADLILFLYLNVLRINFKDLKHPGRDYLFLSKGHDVPALYGVFAELGIIDEERLKNHLKTNDYIFWHPNVNIPGIEFHSGSLGHLLSIAMGVALDCRLREQSNKIYVILGDGELNEGSVWEGLLVASAFKISNLVVIIDRNKFQANIETEKLIPLEPLKAKFESFGLKVFNVNGHDFSEMNRIFCLLHEGNDKPVVIIADTIRGKGLPSIEERADRWFCNFSKEETEQLLLELHGGSKTNLVSETLIVR